MGYGEGGATSITVGWEVRWCDSVSVAEAVLEFLGGEGGVLEGVGCEGEPAACPGGAKELLAVSRGSFVADAVEGALAFGTYFTCSHPCCI